jgi:cell division septum initiation protein DivIVA
MSTNYDASDPDQIRANIERTRSELGSDVDALADKVTPSKIVDREKEKLRGRVDGVKDRVFGAASDARDSVVGAKDSAVGSVSGAGSSLSDASHKAAQKAEGNPLAVGLIAFGVGLLAASLIPASDKEKELASQAKDAAAPALHEMQDVAKGIAEDLKEPAQEAAHAVQETAQEAAQNVKSTATDEAENVKSSAQDARGAVQDSATP